jgi:hypothetical protein
LEIKEIFIGQLASRSWKRAKNNSEGKESGLVYGEMLETQLSEKHLGFLKCKPACVILLRLGVVE